MSELPPTAPPPVLPTAPSEEPAGAPPPSSPPPPKARRRIVVAPAVRLGRITWRVLPWLGFSVAVFAVVRVMGVRAEALAQVVVGCASALAYGFLIALMTEVLSPDRADLRLVPLADAQARRLAAALKFLFFFTLATEYGAWILESNDWHPELASVLRIWRNVVLILVAWAVLSALGLFRWMASGSPGKFWGALGRFSARFLVPLSVLTALFMAIALDLGYVPLARYVAENSLSTALKLAVGMFAYRWLRARLYSTVHFYRSDDTEDSDETTKSSRRETDPVALGVETIGGGILLLLISVGTILWVLADWDLTPNRLWALLSQPIVSSGSTTWGQFLGGLTRIFAVVFLGWLVRSILTYFAFPKSSIGVGARYAILAMLRYAVIGFVAIFALSALGIDTSSMGWFLGAAGAGIGFGLKDIIGNFISGLIMLVERPIRVGDNVQVGDAVGKVENIHMRGTVLRTFDNTTILIPNRQLLDERVTNLTYGMEHARVIVEVGVSYDADPRRVRELLLDVARDHPKVKDDPEPGVLFMDFADSCLLFRLVTYTAEVTGRFGVASELRTEIFERLGGAGIEIPFPQRDLHLKSGWPGPGAVS